MELHGIRWGRGNPCTHQDVMGYQEPRKPFSMTDAWRKVLNVCCSQQKAGACHPGSCRGKPCHSDGTTHQLRRRKSRYSGRQSSSTSYSDSLSRWTPRSHRRIADRGLICFLSLPTSSTLTIGCADIAALECWVTSSLSSSKTSSGVSSAMLCWILPACPSVLWSCHRVSPPGTTAVSGSQHPCCHALLLQAWLHSVAAVARCRVLPALCCSLAISG